MGCNVASLLTALSYCYSDLLTLQQACVVPCIPFNNIWWTLLSRALHIGYCDVLAGVVMWGNYDVNMLLTCTAKRY